MNIWMNDWFNTKYEKRRYVSISSYAHKYLAENILPNILADNNFVRTD